MKSLLATAFALSLATPVAAGEAAVIDAKAERSGGAWRFDVTVKHADEDWEHYADAWRIVGPNGAIYGERTLLHPHAGEQPFTRSLEGVAIPTGVETVLIEAHDSRHGWGAKVLEFRLPD